MINLSMLLSNNLFSGFRLVSGAEGLENRVVSTGVFDWEDEEKLREYFPEGALIFTTLSMYKDDRDGAEAVIRLMIGNKPAAIAIKEQISRHEKEQRHRNLSQIIRENICRQ